MVESPCGPWAWKPGAVAPWCRGVVAPWSWSWSLGVLDHAQADIMYNHVQFVCIYIYVCVCYIISNFMRKMNFRRAHFMLIC